MSGVALVPAEDSFRATHGRKVSNASSAANRKRLPGRENLRKFHANYHGMRIRLADEEL